MSKGPVEGDGVQSQDGNAKLGYRPKKKNPQNNNNKISIINRLMTMGPNQLEKSNVFNR